MQRQVSLFRHVMSLHAQSHLTLQPHDCSPQGSSLHGMSHGKRQEYWSGLPFPLPGDLPDPGIELSSLVSPLLQGMLYCLSHEGSPLLSQKVHIFPENAGLSNDFTWHAQNNCTFYFQTIKKVTVLKKKKLEDFKSAFFFFFFAFM